MAKRGPKPHPTLLTPREGEVLALIRDGLTNAQIAAHLNISPETAKYHVSEILSKLNVGTREEAALWQPAESHQPHRRLGWWLIAAPAAAAVCALIVLAGLIAWNEAASDEAQAEPGWTTCEPPTLDQSAPGVHLFDLTTCELSFTSIPRGANPVWTPGQDRVAYTTSADLYVMDIDAATPIQLTDTPGVSEEFPVWSPDGTQIVYASLSPEQAAPNSDDTAEDWDYDLYVIDVESRATRKLTSAFGCPNTYSWSPDGSTIVAQNYCGLVTRLELIDVASGERTTFAEHGALPLWSPDGQVIVFACPVEGQFGMPYVCVASPEGDLLRTLTVTQAPGADDSDGPYLRARNPFWTADGNALVILGYSSDAYFFAPDASGIATALPDLANRDPRWASSDIIPSTRCDAATTPYYNWCTRDEVVSQRLDSGEERVIIRVPCQTFVHWAPSGLQLLLDVKDQCIFF